MNINTVPSREKGSTTKTTTVCYHCGEQCDQSIASDHHYFCCEGCLFVYDLLKDNQLCNYYELDKTPGIKVKGRFDSDKFAFLDEYAVQQKLISFKDEKQTHLTFHLPQMHCASCIWLLENLHRLDPGILFSKTIFHRKEVFIGFDHHLTSVRKIVEILAFVGYEPYISLNEMTARPEKKINRRQFYKLGVAGFCFSNIMMLSFPEYFSSGHMNELNLRSLFPLFNLFLSLPVFFYCASDFFVSAWKGLRQKWLNIDAPIALSILITFSRSVYEVTTATGAGYFDSMSGIVLFMLIGRWFQNKTYDALSFDRDYASYFPLGVTRIDEGTESKTTINQLVKGDHIKVYNEEMIPADAILLSVAAQIDYSFVSGETTPVLKRKGELIYAGARHTGPSIELEVIKPVEQSYITQLWNNTSLPENRKNKDRSFIHPWSRYFTVVLFSIAAIAAIYWWVVDPHKVLPAVSASLIVACPCSLLLSTTFTFGNMLRYFGRNKCYLKNASVIEAFANVNTIVFDKTGTITETNKAAISYSGIALNPAEALYISDLASQSSHPLSQLLKEHLRKDIPCSAQAVSFFREWPGKGIQGQIDGHDIFIGSSLFINGMASDSNRTCVWVKIGGSVKGHFEISNAYLKGIPYLITNLENLGYSLHLLSGDNESEKTALQEMFSPATPLVFHQSPADKMSYINKLKEDPSKKVLMLGDGLNDAGALMASDAGVAVTENTSQFTPASDAILHRSQVQRLDALLSYAQTGKKIVMASWIISILYNVAGLSFAVQAKLSPMVAAILMPASSITLVCFVTLATTLAARKRRL